MELLQLRYFLEGERARHAQRPRKSRSPRRISFSRLERELGACFSSQKASIPRNASRKERNRPATSELARFDEERSSIVRIK